ncbi:hypothetical protein [Pseudoalteromonas sp. P1-11]
MKRGTVFVCHAICTKVGNTCHCVTCRVCKGVIVRRFTQH